MWQFDGYPGRSPASALVHLNGSVGRGSSGVDLNAIPLSVIDHIEVLRDGAAARSEDR